MKYEIERKFFIKKLPNNLEKFDKNKIKQGYINYRDNAPEIRLRQKDNRFFQTIKIGDGLKRKEYEIELSEYQFQVLWPLAKNRFLRKTRYKIPYKKRVCEVDIYAGDLKGLITAEIEFETVEQSKRFVFPKWFGIEITGKTAYKNKNLAIKGLPKNYERNNI